MNIAVIPSYQFTATLPEASAFEITCDSTTMTCDSTWTVDYNFIPLKKNTATILAYSFEYTLPDYMLYLLCDNTYITGDNLITCDTL